MSKLTKLLKNPGIFWRDHFLKKYPEDIGQYLERTPTNNAQKQLLNTSFVRHHEFEAFPVNFPIDIVYTWVDGSDPVWLEKKLRTEGKLAELDRVVSDSARFKCRGELRFSLRSVFAYASWVNKIYIVTDSQVPKWFVPTSDKVRIVDHSEIIPKRFLPTFNSHVIEAHLHNIPDLSEHYIYFNDDIMLTREISPEHFFAGNGNAHLFITNSFTPVGPQNPYDTPTQKAAKNVRALIEKQFNRYIYFNFAHTFHPQLKSTNIDIYKLWQNRIEEFLKNRFRGDNDLAFATYLAPNYTYLSGKADLRRTSCMYFNIRSAAAKRHYQVLLRRKNTAIAPYSMCLNDVQTVGEKDKHRELEEILFLQEYFPNSCPFEDDNSPTIHDEYESIYKERYN